MTSGVAQRLFSFFRGLPVAERIDERIFVVDGREFVPAPPTGDFGWLLELLAPDHLARCPLDALVGRRVINAYGAGQMLSAEYAEGLENAWCYPRQIVGLRRLPPGQWWLVARLYDDDWLGHVDLTLQLLQEARREAEMPTDLRTRWEDLQALAPELPFRETRG